MPFFGIQTSKEGLLLRLQGLVEAAAKGQLLDPKQKDPKQKVTTKDPQPCQPSLSESWTTVSRKKKQQSSRTSKGEGKRVSEQSLKLRAHDWPSHRVVRTAFEFGHVLDKGGSEKPLVFLASSQDELRVILKSRQRFWCRARLLGIVSSLILARMLGSGVQVLPMRFLPTSRTLGGELQSGAAGNGSVVKGPIRVKKGSFIG